MDRERGSLLFAMQKISKDQVMDSLYLNVGELTFLRSFIKSSSSLALMDVGRGILKFMRIGNHVLVTNYRTGPTSVQLSPRMLHKILLLIEDAIVVMRSPF